MSSTNASPEFSSACGESWLTAAMPTDNPYCSCKLSRVRSRPGDIHEMHAALAAASRLGQEDGLEMSEAAELAQVRP